MSRLKSLIKNKGATDGKSQTKQEVKKETEVSPPVPKAGSRLAGIIKESTPATEAKDDPSKLEEHATEHGPSVRVENAEDSRGTLSEVPVTKPSRLASIGIEVVQPPPELSVDEELEAFKGDLMRLEEMVDKDAPELRQGVLSVMERMQTKSHIEEYLYRHPSAIRAALRGFRRQFTKRNAQVVVHRKKRKAVKTEVDDFLAELDAMD